jgi:hypothetical protein
MSVNYNKSKATAFNGLGVYSDNYDSLNNTITISNANGNTTILGKVNISSISNDNVCVNNNTACNNSIIDGTCTVNGELHNNNTIYCKNLISSNDVLFPFKIIGYFYINNISYPIIKSCYNTVAFYTNLNLRDLLYNNTNTSYLLIFPYYSISFYSANNTLIQTINNTTGSDLLYSQIILSSNYIIKFIVKYNNNII